MLQPVRIIVWVISIAAAAMFLVLAGCASSCLFRSPRPRARSWRTCCASRPHQALYTEPSLRYISFPIMPGFPAVVALLARVVDAAIWEPRIVSTLAACLTGALVVRIVWLETQSWTLAVAGGGLFFMASGGVVGPYDLGRPEPLMLAARAARALGAALRHRAIDGGGLGDPAGGGGDDAARSRVVRARGDHPPGDQRPEATDRARAVGHSVVGGRVLVPRPALGTLAQLLRLGRALHTIKFDGGQLVMFVRDMLLRSFGAVTVAVLLSCAMPKRPWVGRDGVWMAMASAGLIIALISTLNPLADPASRTALVLGFAIFGPLALHVVVKHLGAWLARAAPPAIT